MAHLKPKQLCSKQLPHWHSHQEAEACIQELPALAHSTSYPEIFKRSYCTMDDLYNMFNGKPKPIGLQQHHTRLVSPRSSGKCSPESSCTFGSIQSCITSYLNAAVSSAFKTAKFEAFRPEHARGNPPRQFSATYTCLREDQLHG